MLLRRQFAFYHFNKVASLFQYGNSKLFENGRKRIYQCEVLILGMQIFEYNIFNNRLFNGTVQVSNRLSRVHMSSAIVKALML
jgi:hypothetical protein